MLLSGLAATIAYVTRVEALLARRSFDLARAQAAADAAIVSTIAGLSDEEPDRRPTIGAPQSWQFEGVPVTIVVSREAGRIDINKAHDELLRAFLEAEGVTGSAAAELLEQLRGRQAGGTSARRITTLLPNATTGTSTPPDVSQLTSPLETLEELRQIPQWRAQPLDCWLDSLTVYSGQPEISFSDATPGALAALQWLQAHNPDSAKAPNPGTQSSFAGEVLRIRALATGAEAFAMSEWVGRLTSDLSRPMLTMRWDHGVPVHSVDSCASQK
jgi:hypothetical protein